MKLTRTGLALTSMLLALPALATTDIFFEHDTLPVDCDLADPLPSPTPYDVTVQADQAVEVVSFPIERMRSSFTKNDEPLVSGLPTGWDWKVERGDPDVVYVYRRPGMGSALTDFDFNVQVRVGSIGKCTQGQLYANYANGQGQAPIQVDGENCIPTVLEFVGGVPADNRTGRLALGLGLAACLGVIVLLRGRA